MSPNVAVIIALKAIMTATSGLFLKRGLFRVPQFPLYLRNAEVLSQSNFAIATPLVFLT